MEYSQKPPGRVIGVRRCREGGFMMLGGTVRNDEEKLCLLFQRHEFIILDSAAVVSQCPSTS